jgi:hypothetical protein
MSGNKRAKSPGWSQTFLPERLSRLKFTRFKAATAAQEFA